MTNDLPPVELVPADDWDQVIALGDDYTGWSVVTARIEWSGGSIDPLSVDLSDAAAGNFTLTAPRAETPDVPIGALSRLTFKIRSPTDIHTTVYHAKVKGVHTRSTNTATALVPGTQGPPGIGDKADVTIFAGGLPLPGERLFRMVMARAISLPAGLTDSRASAEIAAAGTSVVSLRRNDVEFGTVTFSASATGVFAAATETVFAAGDILEIMAPDPQDAALSDVSITLAGDRITA